MAERDDNDRLRDGDLPDDPFGGLVRLVPPTASEAPDVVVAYQTAPDGRPYLVVPPGDRGWFVATASGYRPCRESLVRSMLMRHWPGLEVNIPNPDPDKPGKAMRPADLHQRYGADCDHIYYCYARSTRFVPKPEHAGDLYVRVLDAVDPQPVKHEDVLAYLEVLCGDRVGILLDWLATMPDLSRPTGIPVLKGKNSLGKSMIPMGASRYFGPAVADYDDVFKGRFNDALLRSPLVILDEKTEVDSKSGRFRKLGANDRHAIEAKNQPSGTLIGCPRIFIVTNGPDPLQLGREDLDADDDDAIGERVILIDCAPEARAWLEDRGGRAFTHDWVERADGSPGKIPETIAWLHKHRRVEVGKRFLVVGDASEWAARIGTRRGLAASILDAYQAWQSMGATEHKRFDPQPFRVDRAYPGRVIVGNKALRDAWQPLMSERPPTHRRLADALRKLAPAGNEKLTLSNGDRPHGYLVPRHLLPDAEDG